MTWCWLACRVLLNIVYLLTCRLFGLARLVFAGHANYRITLDMYVGTTTGVLDRARTATQ